MKAGTAQFAMEMLLYGKLTGCVSHMFKAAVGGFSCAPDNFNNFTLNLIYMKMPSIYINVNTIFNLAFKSMPHLKWSRCHTSITD